jgi:hypothetical protein
MDRYGILRRRVLFGLGKKIKFEQRWLKLIVLSSSLVALTKRISPLYVESFSLDSNIYIRKERYTETLRLPMFYFRPPERSSWQISEWLRSLQISNHNGTHS